MDLLCNEMDTLILDSRARCGPSSRTAGDPAPPDLTRGTGPVTKADRAVDHDATLLVAALEVVESRRAAIEWLLEADLLCLCLV
jgi:hypothetical protein